jgi:hypothetical protein
VAELRLATCSIIRIWHIQREHLEQQDVRQSFWRDTRVPTRERCFSAALSRIFQNLFPQIFLSQQDYLIIKFLKKAAAPFNGFSQALEGVW